LKCERLKRLKGPWSVLEVLVVTSVRCESAIGASQIEGRTLTRRCRLLDDSGRSRDRAGERQRGLGSKVRGAKCCHGTVPVRNAPSHACTHLALVRRCKKHDAAFTRRAPSNVPIFPFPPMPFFSLFPSQPSQPRYLAALVRVGYDLTPYFLVVSRVHPYRTYSSHRQTGSTAFLSSLHALFGAVSCTTSAHLLPYSYNPEARDRISRYVGGISSSTHLLYMEC